MNELPFVLTPSDIKDYLKIGWNKVYELLSSGEIPSKRVGKQYRISKSKFIEWMEGDKT
jgi:excisionase family DNA binding protein